MTKINLLNSSMKKYNQEEAIEKYSNSINHDECYSYEFLNNLVVDYNSLFNKDEKSNNDLIILNYLRSTIAVSIKSYACNLAQKALNNVCLVNHTKKDDSINYAESIYLPKLISFIYSYIFTRIMNGEVEKVTDINDLVGNNYQMDLYKFVIDEYSNQQIVNLYKYGVDVSETNRVTDSKKAYYIPQKVKVASTK